MPNCNHTNIQTTLSEAHSGDKEQLEAIFSNSSRLIIEAPAGYGKTKTMVSKIAYILASGKLPIPKKILALTFGVNAAYKIKKDVSEQLPKLLKSEGLNPAKINEKVFISNYHGFCRHILRLYGYLLHDNLKNIDTMRTTADSDARELFEMNFGLTFDDSQELSILSDEIKKANEEYINQNRRSYINKVISHLISNNYITYNAIILLTLQLFEDFPEILIFYQKYFPILIIDEFQDTNIINYNLIKQLVSNYTSTIFVGDPLQRIYGFIGAIPDLMEDAKKEFNMNQINLKTNYRFKDNPKMLLLDKNIRLYAENPIKPNISNNALIDLNVLYDQSEESNYLVEKIYNILQKENDERIAILVRSRNRNVFKIIDILEEKGVDYFYGLYTDEDENYIDFHKKCLNTFRSHISNNDRITKLNLRRFYREVQQHYEKENSQIIIHSLFDLLKIFLDRLVTEYSFLTNEDKIIFTLDTFENGALKQQMEFIDTNVILATVHSAKGLEWDYVILPDMEQYGFPLPRGLCGKCGSNNNRRIVNGFCKLIYSESIEKELIEELSVFYVSVTRAKKEVFFTASKKRIHYTGEERNSNISCLLSLPGIETNCYQS